MFVQSIAHVFLNVARHKDLGVHLKQTLEGLVPIVENFAETNKNIFRCAPLADCMRYAYVISSFMVRDGAFVVLDCRKEKYFFILVRRGTVKVRTLQHPMHYTLYCSHELVEGKSLCVRAGVNTFGDLLGAITDRPSGWHSNAPYNSDHMCALWTYHDFSEGRARYDRAPPWWPEGGYVDLAATA